MLKNVVKKKKIQNCYSNFQALTFYKERCVQLIDLCCSIAHVIINVSSFRCPPLRVRTSSCQFSAHSFFLNLPSRSMVACFSAGNKRTDRLYFQEPSSAATSQSGAPCQMCQARAKHTFGNFVTRLLVQLEHTLCRRWD